MVHTIYCALLVLLIGVETSLWATDARVLCLGRYDASYMDDFSIYRNPANVNIFPNMLIGSLGYYIKDLTLDDTSSQGNQRPYNRDPQHPYFGGIVSFAPKQQSQDFGQHYPMLSIGFIFNRYDQFLDYITPESSDYLGAPYNGTSTINWAKPAGKIDILGGYALKNGIMFGLGGYLAVQKRTDHSRDMEESKIIKGTAGINMPLEKTMNLEVSINGGQMTKIGMIGDTQKIVVAKDDYFFRGDLRLFSSLTSLNGDFVPHAYTEYFTFQDGKYSRLKLEGGIAINLNVDRGFFWSGIDLLYDKNDGKYKPLTKSFDQCDLYGGKVSFGIERNFFWDWLVWRIGGTKLVGFQYWGGPDGKTEWYENPEADASDRDHIAFGWAINFENRFKVDAIMAEDIFYTLTNLLTHNNQHHIFTRFTATYSF